MTSASVRLGVHLSNAVLDEPGASLRRLAAEVEQRGLASLWVGDHLAWHQPMLDPLALLGMLAGATENIRFGTSVLLLGWRSPMWTAKELGTLWLLSDGRLTVGAGIGGEATEDARLTGVDPGRRVARLEEALAVARLVWSGRAGRASIDGGEVDVPAHLLPSPAAPQVLLGGRVQAAVDRAARLADGWCGVFLRPERFRALVDRARQAVGERPFACHMTLWAHVGTGRTRAEAEAFVRRFYGPDGEAVSRHCVFGSADDVAAAVAAYQAAGADEIQVVLPYLARLEDHDPTLVALAQLDGDA